MRFIFCRCYFWIKPINMEAFHCSGFKFGSSVFKF
jgi:hypothetical protein